MSSDPYIDSLRNEIIKCVAIMNSTDFGIGMLCGAALMFVAMLTWSMM